MLPSQALECFVGAWGFINATLVNTTSNTLIPEWHSVHPSGMSVYDPTGHLSFIITANDTTEPEKRPRELSLPAKPTDSDARWALVGKYSVAAGGTIKLSDLDGGSCCAGKGKTGLKGVQTSSFTTATLPSWVGYQLVNRFEFFDNGRVHVLRTNFAADLVQSVFFYKM